MPTPRQTPSQRLLTRLREQGMDLPENTVVLRTHAGTQQRNAGAWAWSLATETSHPIYGTLHRPLDAGSQYPVTTLLRCTHGWSIAKPPGRFNHDTYIDPCDTCARAH